MAMCRVIVELCEHHHAVTYTEGCMNDRMITVDETFEEVRTDLDGYHVRTQLYDYRRAGRSWAGCCR